MGFLRGRREAFWLLGLALATTALFASGTLDIDAAGWFYQRAGADHWPLAQRGPWPLVYRVAPWLTAVLVSAALAALAASLTSSRRHWRRAALLVLLAVVIGPGLLGNALFKDHWQHPRPRELAAFGGSAQYVAAPLPGHAGGASFPCGHCTVGFLYASGWWLWRQRRALARASLALGLTLGTLLGVGRMAAGAHFLSDILWSALLAFAVVHVLHDLVLPVPAGATAPSAAPPASAKPAALRPWAVAALAALGGLSVLAALFLAPHGGPIAERVPLAGGAAAPRILEVRAERADIEIVLADGAPREVRIEGELHGFGLPGSRLALRVERQAQPLPVLRCLLEERGWLTDVDALARLYVPASAFSELRVSVRRGDIAVTDLTEAQVSRSGGLHLQLQALHGHVVLRSGPTGRASA